MNSKLANNDRGFTLLEMIVVMAIMILIAFGIYNVVSEVFQLREVLATEGDFYNEIRLSISILQRDVQLIYNPTLMLQVPGANTPNAQPSTPPSTTPQQNAQQAQELQAGDLALTSNFWLAAVNVGGLRPSRFNGTENKISFIANSHQRIYKESPESEFAKISYELKRDDNLDGYSPADKERLRDTQVLIKTEDADTFEMDDTKQKNDKLNHVYPLLHGIKKFKFRYYAKNTDQWYPTWDNLTPDFQGKFPDMIELTVEVIGVKNLSYDGFYIFRPEAPLNGLDPSS